MTGRLSDDPRLAPLMGGIYDAALDPSLWPETLRRLAEFTGGRAAGLVLKDTVSKAGDAHRQFGADPDFVDRYRTDYWSAGRSNTGPRRPRPLPRRSMP